jgi:NTE family protein
MSANVETQNLDRPRRAFVLSGGGNLGAAQSGASLALLERGITPDLVVGTSAGAINAAHLAGRPNLDGARELADLWSATRSRDIFRLPRNPISLIRRLRGDALYDNAGLRTLLEGHLPFGSIEDAEIDLRIVATDFETGLESAFHSGPVVDAVLASTALPGLFPPVRIGDRLYVDGGIADNVPISPAVGAGAKEIYVIHVGFNCPLDRPRALDVLWRSIGLLLNRALAQDIKRFSAKADIIVLPTLCVPPTPIWNLGHSRFLIAESYRTVGAFLDARAEGAHEAAS